MISGVKYSVPFEEKLKQQAVNELTTRDKVEQMLGDYS